MGLYLKLTFVGIIACTSLFANTKRLNYIEDYKYIAVKEMERTGIPASIKLAQALLESGAGSSTLARTANNHFGIKCGSRWDGEAVYRKDDDYDKDGNLKKSCFRKYQSAAQSFEAHSEFLQRNKRYGGLFELEMTNYKGWANGLRKAGYATNPSYSRLLISIIERYELYKYDQLTSDHFTEAEILAANKKMEAKATIAAAKPKQKESKPAAIEKPVAVAKPARMKIVPTIGYVNEVKMTQAIGDESIAKIAHRTKTPAKAIVRFNENYTVITDIPEAGERIFLQAKRTAFRAKQRVHRVNAGESMYDIAQEYGVRLRKLYERNLMTIPEQAAVGQYVMLSGRRKHAPKLRSASDKEQSLTAMMPTNLDILGENSEEYLDWEEASAGLTVSIPTKPKRIVAKPILMNRPPVVKPSVPATTYPDAPQPTLPQTKEVEQKAVQEQYYEVQAGDSLYRIARTYALSVEQLKTWNNLNTNVIRVGQRLRIE